MVRVDFPPVLMELGTKALLTWAGSDVSAFTKSRGVGTIKLARSAMPVKTLNILRKFADIEIIRHIRWHPTGGCMQTINNNNLKEINRFQSGYKWTNLDTIYYNKPITLSHIFNIRE